MTEYLDLSGVIHRVDPDIVFIVLIYKNILLRLRFNRSASLFDNNNSPDFSVKDAQQLNWNVSVTNITCCIKRILRIYEKAVSQINQGILFASITTCHFVFPTIFCRTNCLGRSSGTYRSDFFVSSWKFRLRATRPITERPKRPRTGLWRFVRQLKQGGACLLWVSSNRPPSCRYWTARRSVKMNSA
jgi:hypothetical protein